MFSLTFDQTALQNRARAFADEVLAPRAAEVDRTEQYPWDNVAAMKDAGFLGMTVPQANGGQGLGWLETSLVVEQIARTCAVSARIVVETNMGGVSAVMAYGSDAQKTMAAGMVLDGDKPAICITEPDAGSAATEMATTAKRVPGGWVLNGHKHWITGGGVSRLHLIFARMIDGGNDLGIGGFLAIRDQTDGLRIGEREPTMGLRGIPEANVYFEDMFVADNMVLIPEGDPRRGFAKLMTAYNSQRVGAATVAIGVARGAYELAVDFVQEREQFGRPIAEFQGLQWMLADMCIGLDASQALIWKAACSEVDGFPDMGLAARAKVLAAETAVKVTNDALQLHGAAGYSRARAVERMVRDARMFTIGGGTAQVLRTQVASDILGQKLPQTRDGYLAKEPQAPRQVA
ncbi:MAG: 3-sulfinopropanoyl-CoA desulfinase [Pseudomonadota bacterium]